MRETLNRNTYEDVGRGCPLVLVHGHPFNRTLWAPQMEALSRHCRVIAPDLRGYGEYRHDAEKTLLADFAADILRLLDQLQLQSCILGGLSMGGQIVMECYREFPERISALILADTFAQLDTPERRQSRLKTADRLLSEGMTQYSREELPKMITRDHVATMPDVAAHIMQMMESTSPVGAAAALRGRAERPDYTPVLRMITVPTLMPNRQADFHTSGQPAPFSTTLVIFRDNQSTCFVHLASHAAGAWVRRANNTHSG